MAEYMLITFLDGSRPIDKIKINLKDIKTKNILNTFQEEMGMDNTEKLVIISAKLYQWIRKYQ